MQGVVEHLPFADGAFDAVMGVLTVHHWTEKAKGMSEIRRVSRGPIVILTFDPAFRDFWLLDYFPELAAIDEGVMPRLDDYAEWLGPVSMTPVLVPHDCTDGFGAAYWRRPAAYLDAPVRAAMSSFWKIGDVTHGVERLRRDLQSGQWEHRYGYLRRLGACDCGYRLVVAS